MTEDAANSILSGLRSLRAIPLLEEFRREDADLATR